MNIFKIGEKAVALCNTKAPVSQTISKGEIYEIKDIVVCKCGIQLLNVNNELSGWDVVKCKCGLLVHSIYHLSAQFRFRKLDYAFANEVIKNICETSQPIDA